MCDPSRKGPEVIGFPDHSARALNGPVKRAAKKPNAPRWVLSLAGRVKALAARKATPRKATTGTARARFLAAIKKS
jgi:hypothetical protein